MAGVVFREHSKNEGSRWARKGMQRVILASLGVSLGDLGGHLGHLGGRLGHLGGHLGKNSRKMMPLVSFP